MHGSDCSLCSLAHKYRETHSFVQLRCKSNVLPAQMLNSNRSRWQSLINGALEKRQTNCKWLPSPFFSFWETSLDSLRLFMVACVQSYIIFYVFMLYRLSKIVIWLHKQFQFSIITLVIWAQKQLRQWECVVLSWPTCFVIHFETVLFSQYCKYVSN